MSIIPKINVGISGKKRSKLNLDFDNSTTMNIGIVQPTMCREMVPNETFKVKTSSLVRLAPMPVPTFARMSLRHYHTFVPFSELWQPFTAFLSGQSFTSSDGTIFVPTNEPSFDFSFLATFILTFSDITILDWKYEPISLSKSDMTRWTEFVGLFKNAEGGFIKNDKLTDNSILYSKDLIHKFHALRGGISLPDYGSTGVFDAGVIRQGGITLSSNDTLLKAMKTYDSEVTNGRLLYDETSGFITFDGADFVFPIRQDGLQFYYVACKLKSPLRNLRSVLLGLGYPFNPFMPDLKFSPFKLIGFYKSWFELFCPNREKTFNETSCYRLIKYISNSDGIAIQSVTNLRNLFQEFLLSIITDCYYYLPQDYFGMSVKSPFDQFGSPDITISSGMNVPSLANDSVTIRGASASATSTNTNIAVHPGLPSNITSNSATMGMVSPLVQRLAQRMLNFAGKNTVIGRQIQDYLRVHYGITAGEHHIDDSSVYKLGSSRVQINVSDIMSTADTETAKIGDYAGKGIGFGESDTIEYTSKEFGCWITLSVLVPESGYYQGYFLENRSLGRFHHFTPEFDSLGYQVLERGEVSADYPVNSDMFDPAIAIGYNNAFGYVPRYSHMKVGRNILNGDLSLHSMKNAMLPYTFDRSFPSYLRKPINDQTVDGTYLRITRPEYIPSSIFDGFRKIDPTDRLGDYNRIFNYVSNDVDHFIVHNLFKVTAIAPMKPLSDSFDSVVEDDKVTSVAKA